LIQDALPLDILQFDIPVAASGRHEGDLPQGSRQIGPELKASRIENTLNLGAISTLQKWVGALLHKNV
jgi:hypothetical protein